MQCVNSAWISLCLCDRVSLGSDFVLTNVDGIGEKLLRNSLASSVCELAHTACELVCGCLRLCEAILPESDFMQCVNSAWISLCLCDRVSLGSDFVLTNVDVIGEKLMINSLASSVCELAHTACELVYGCLRLCEAILPESDFMQCVNSAWISLCLCDRVSLGSDFVLTNVDGIGEKLLRNSLASSVCELAHTAYELVYGCLRKNELIHLPI